MKRGGLLTVAVVGLLAATQGCTSPVAGDPTTGITARVSVLSDPAGGVYVSKLSCTFEAVQLSGTDTGPLQIRVSWIAPCGVHKTEVLAFRGGSQTYTTTYSEAGGYPIDKTFWVDIAWEDADGAHHIRSASAACYAS
jgi:hypothetical protein